MGRKKPGKIARQRKGTFTLQELEPPGYDEWFKIDPGFTADAAAADPRLDDEAVDLMRRFARLRPLYRGPIPMQAVQLDMVLETGSLPVTEGADDEGVLVPLQEFATVLGIDPATEDMRESFHRLHSTGAILVADVGESVPFIRIVSQPPAQPGEPWIFRGTPEAKLAPQTCIPARPGDLPNDEFAALAFIRYCMSEGIEARPEQYAERQGVGSVEEARQLFAAVADLARQKGCPACPSGHLCTRPGRAGAPS
ncbi:hypothetical protein [Streptomyces sp. NPDC001054]